MNTAVIVKRFLNSAGLATWANGLIGNYLPEDCGLGGVIVNSIVSIQAIPPAIDDERWLVILLVEVWCPGTEENDPA